MSEPGTIGELIEKAAKETRGKLEKHVNFLTAIVVGICIVLLLTVGGFIQSCLATKAATYQSLVDKINEQNTIVKILSDRLDKSNTELEQTNKDLDQIKTCFKIK